VEKFFWDGLALIKRSTNVDGQKAADATSYLNEPAVTGGNPILADEHVLFNDMLGTTLGTYGKEFKEINRTTFGSGSEKGFFTGKPYVKELGAVFLFRNYRPELGKWQTSDPLGYPDGWNNFAYVNNWVTNCIDWLGMTERSFTSDDITYTYDWSTASLYQIIGITDSIDPVFNATGDKVTAIWRLNVSWECENCDEGGTITHYQVASVYPCDWSGTNLPAFDIPTFNNIYEGIGNVISTIVGTYYAVTHVVNVGPDGMNNINGSRPSDTAPLTNFKGIDHECAE
jgi:RHS repeat-associated protein